ncbi:MAG: 30S ribosomal protein S20 [Planctomycetota bacterium]
MPHKQSAMKELRKSRRRRRHNKALNSAMRTQAKKVLEAPDPKTAAAQLPRAQKLLDKAAKTRRIHPNKAARLKSRLSRKAAGR